VSQLDLPTLCQHMWLLAYQSKTWARSDEAKRIADELLACARDLVSRVGKPTPPPEPEPVLPRTYKSEWD